MNAKPVIWVLFTLLATCVLPNAAAEAHGPYFAWRGFAPWTYVPRSVYTVERRPYFAVNPPVYYSYPVSRPYGHFPYPYLLAPPSRSVARECPMVVQNPYVAGETVAKMQSDDAGVPPRATLPPRVQVVYPAAVFSNSKSMAVSATR
jgi:hypothetical protein